MANIPGSGVDLTTVRSPISDRLVLASPREQSLMALDCDNETPSSLAGVDSLSQTTANDTDKGGVFPVTLSQEQNNSSSTVTPLKRGYKSHVPSACINCKKAHLACDVSRPCKRCVALGKTETCQDIKHKKRGRPRLHANQQNNARSLGAPYEVMYGTIQTPTFSTGAQRSQGTAFLPQQTCTIAFVHEPIEAFQSPSKQENSLASSFPTLSTTPPPSAFLPSMSLSPFQMPLGDSTFQTLKDRTASLQQDATMPLYMTSHPVFDYTEDQMKPDNTTVPQNMPGPPLASSPSLFDLCISPESSSGARPSSHPSGKDQQTVTLFMFMDARCALVSDEVTSLWGYYPQEFAYRSLYDFVSSKDADRLARLHRMLMDNVTESAKQTQPSYTGPTESGLSLTTVFQSTDPLQLATVARGSNTFSDTLHIKLRSGTLELYGIKVCMGGGLGADLYNPSSHNKLYIIAKLRKHEYKVSAQDASFETLPIQFFASSFRHATSLDKEQTGLSSIVVSPDDHSQRAGHHDTRSPSSDSNFGNIPAATQGPQSTPTDNNLLGKSTLNARGYASQTYPVMSPSKGFTAFQSPILGPPKINVAPISTPNQADRHRQLQGHTGYRSLVNHSADHLPPVNATKDMLLQSSLFSRYPPISAGKPAPLAPQSSPQVTHPTTQYFLQTSSSSLNAAASAVQCNSRAFSMRVPGQVVDDKGISGKTESNRKVEMSMSIRSLLCGSDP